MHTKSVSLSTWSYIFGQSWQRGIWKVGLAYTPVGENVFSSKYRFCYDFSKAKRMRAGRPDDCFLGDVAPRSVLCVKKRRIPCSPEDPFSTSESSNNLFYYFSCPTCEVANIEHKCARVDCEVRGCEDVHSL